MDMYSRLPNLVIGFHGCNEEVFNAVVRQGETIEWSKNDYDWLGHGIYFWEQNYERARLWAKEHSCCNKKLQPAVIGAVIDLGNCLNLMDSRYIEMLAEEYNLLVDDLRLAGAPLPQNRGGKDWRLRKLDCAVVEHLHARLTEMEESQNDARIEQFDSARGLFSEGPEIYPKAGFKLETHVQICIRNPNCIKGFFAPMKEDPKWRMP
mgnify:CR=1 FL=1